MSRETWYFFDSGPLHPFWNMGMDEALLTEWRGTPVILRFYSWHPPGLSLGYFQRYDELKDAAAVRECGAAITRRITGGDAILHFRDLTFSLVGLEGTRPFDGPLEGSYRRIHQALARGIGLLGGEARPRRSPSQEKASGDGRCFYRVSRYDLVAEGKKLVGSAQRRTLGKVLHHGSIPLVTNPLTPEAANLSRLAGRSVDYCEAVRAVKRGFEEVFGVRFQDFAPGEAVKARAEELARNKYGARAWVARR